MFRRSIMAIVACLGLTPHASAMERPYRVSLIGDAFDGKSWQTGVLIELDKGWKTYWRNPGEAGIPPDFAWKTSVPAEVAVKYPTPGRYRDDSGETLGYEREAVFPVTVAAGPATSVHLDLSLFFAVCKDVCIPAKAEASILLGPVAKDRAGAAKTERAMAAVPVPGDIVSAASIAVESGKPVLVLRLDRQPGDIFVETSTGAYFRAPRFSADGRHAHLIIDNVTDVKKLEGAMLKLTMTLGDQGLEQNVTLP
jgi:DsbC/DsbD-like thiol-disulfide interchange protein